jgi:hypothetical protein
VQSNTEGVEVSAGVMYPLGAGAILGLNTGGRRWSPQAEPVKVVRRERRYSMSVQAMSWVFDHSEATGSCRLVLLSIANHASPDGTNAWPSVATIAAEARVSRSTAFRAIGELEEDGSILVEHGRGGPEVVRADRKPNRYTVVMSSSGSQSDTPSDGVRSARPRGPIHAATGSEDRTRTVLEPSMNSGVITEDGDEAQAANVEATARLRDAADLAPPEITDEDRERGLANLRANRARLHGEKVDA